MSNYHIPKISLNHSLDSIAETVNKISRSAGVSLIALIFNWEHDGAWTGPTGLFPPREGKQNFISAMKSLRKNGNYGFVYVPGGCWYLKLPYCPKFDSWKKFNAIARKWAIKDVNGNIPVGMWYKGWETTRLCPSTVFLKKLTSEIVEKCLRLGCSIVQIDNFPCSGSEACYDKKHKHPPGYGSWWSKRWCEILEYVRENAKKQNMEFALTTEGISECFIPYIDMFDERSGNMEYFGHFYPGLPWGARTIPMFSYVYGQYITAYCAAYPECNRPETIYWTRCIGKSLCHKVIPTTGKYFPKPDEINPEIIKFYEKIARITKKFWNYIVFGRLIRPPDIDAPQIIAEYGKMILTERFHFLESRKKRKVRDYVIQHSAFESEDGSIAYFFINISKKRLKFRVKFKEIFKQKPVLWKKYVNGILAGERFYRKFPVKHEVVIDGYSTLIFILTNCTFSTEKRCNF